LNGCKIFFCSSDRAAISFALYNDISCLLKRDNLYFVYHSTHNRTMDSFGNREKFEALCKEAPVIIPTLIECVTTLESLGTEWKSLLLGIKDATNFEKIKELTTVAMHYHAMRGRYTDIKMEDFKRFIENPHDPHFDNYHSSHNLMNALKEISKVVRSYKYLNKYETRADEKHYGLFDFGNTDSSKFDMVCGLSLMTLFINSCKPELVTFALDAIDKIIELSDYNVELITLYTLAIELNRDTIEKYTGGYRQVGGSVAMTRASMQWIGDYLASWQMPGIGAYGTIYLSAHHNITLMSRTRSDEILQHLMYKKRIIPKNYKEYLEDMKSFYPDGDWPRQHVLDFLKTNLLKRNSLRKNISRRNNRRFGTRKHNYKRFLLNVKTH